MNNIVRMIVIFVFAVVFFVTSSVAERRLKLERTGIAFYSLGSCFLPITLFAAGYFKVFGQWFSLFGGGKYLLIAAAFALMSAVFAKGSSDYKSTIFSWSALASASASVASLLRLICGEWTLAFVFVSIYSLMLVLL